ncbi:LLM class flavin-dependent oxidoreductase, partial [Halomonas sp. THAF12]|uniref:LLM class flavin-dependent oxidoreductase n=1 Tax=Halomonas sp. B23F22_10 TaxID=3459515 RepID=UPI00373E3978
SIFPKPVQKQLPIWVTSGGNPETFRRAGEIGANLLTHLLGQSLESLKENIQIYRKSLKDNGYDSNVGKVSIMLHTFIDKDEEYVRQKIEEPFKEYLRSSAGLLEDFVGSMASEKKLNEYNEEDFEDIISAAFDRYYQSSGLFGTPKQCLEIVNKLKEIGIDEIGSLIDFGVDEDAVLNGLNHLRSLKELSIEPPKVSIEDVINKHNISIIQCTPS